MLERKYEGWCGGKFGGLPNTSGGSLCITVLGE
jgi:hypothetical protein